MNEIISKAKLIKQVSIKTGIITDDVKLVLETFIETISNEVFKGYVVSIHGFGSFQQKTKSERIVNNLGKYRQGLSEKPEPMILPIRKVFSFRPHPALRKKIKCVIIQGKNKDGQEQLNK